MDNCFIFYRADDSFRYFVVSESDVVVAAVAVESLEKVATFSSAFFSNKEIFSLCHLPELRYEFSGICRKSLAAAWESRAWRVRVNCSRRLNLSTVCWASRNKEDSKEIAVTPGAKSTCKKEPLCRA